MPVCIAGMHRSGTSMVARLLNLAGLYLGEEATLMPATDDNPDGFWEHLGFVRVNDELLNERGGGWDYPVSIPEYWTDDIRLSPLRNKAESVVAEFIAHKPWGWKDPRNSLTLPFWQAVAGPLKVVLCVRNPIEVVLSLKRRNFFSYSLSLSLWEAYNRQVLEATAPPDRLVTHYDAYFEDPQFELRRLCDFVGLDVTPAVREACASAIAGHLRHHRLASAHLVAADIAPDILSLYQRLCVEARRHDDAALLAMHTTPRAGATPATVPVSLSNDRGPADVGQGFADKTSEKPVRRVNAVVIDLLRQLDDLLSSVAQKTAEIAVKESTIAQMDLALAELKREHDGLRSSAAEKDAAAQHVRVGDGNAATATVIAGAVEVVKVDEQHDAVPTEPDALTHHKEFNEQLEAEVSSLRRERDAARARCEQLEASMKRQYDHLKGRLRDLIDKTIPDDAAVLMVSRGDDELVHLNGRRAGHFPQALDGAWAGHHPADSAEAIAQLEALTINDRAFLVFPTTSRWWLDHYAEFRMYLETRCRIAVDREDTGVIFEVPELAWPRQVGAAIAKFRKRFGRDPAILNWNSGLELAAAFPYATVFGPPEACSTLPYLDSSVDIVVCSSSEAVAEARRVASGMIVTVSRVAAGKETPARRTGQVTARSESIVDPSSRRTGRARGRR